MSFFPLLSIHTAISTFAAAEAQVGVVKACV